MVRHEDACSSKETKEKPAQQMQTEEQATDTDTKESKKTTGGEEPGEDSNEAICRRKSVLDKFSTFKKKKPLKPLEDLSHTKCVYEICKDFADEESLRFFAIGDWGGKTTAQENVAKAMLDMGDDHNKKTHFQIALGDNIYLIGVQKMDDGRLQAAFEAFYPNTGALSKRWYIIAGNHDHYGNVEEQMAYTNYSNRWVFPEFYYTVRYEIANGVRIDLVMIDTILLCGNTREDKYKTIIDYYTASADDRKTTGPCSKTVAETQWQWIEDQLNGSKADYLFVAGHYPVYSIAEHGPTQCLVDKLHPMLHKYKVDVYFCGHDHNLQHLNVTEDGWTVLHVLSGAAAFEKRSKENAHKVPDGSSQYIYPPKRGKWEALAARFGNGLGGFVYVEVGQEEAIINYMIAPSTVDRTYTTKKLRLSQNRDANDEGEFEEIES